jgi:hypothetical protein
MQRIDLLDFSGGISEQYAADGFTQRQWSKIKGFILDSETSIRTQWAGQSIGTNITNGAKAVSGFNGSLNSYLVAIANDGYVWWAIAPSNSANYTATNAVSWTKLTDILPNTDYRFICDMLLPIDLVGEVNSLLLNSVSGTTPAVALYEDDVLATVVYKKWNTYFPVDQPNLIEPLPGEILNTANAQSFTSTTTATNLTGFTNTTARWTIVNDGPNNINVYVDATFRTSIRAGDAYQSPTAKGAAVISTSTGTGTSVCRLGITLGTYPSPRANIMPRANVGVMWRNRLVLGDINNRITPTQAWTTENIQRAPYAFIYSESSPDTFHEQAILYAGSGESQILSMHVLDDALITISSPATDTDGIRIHKGSLDYIGLQEGNSIININILRGGVGPVQDISASGNRVASTVWPEAGTVVFLDHLGGVWYTDGSEVDRLDRIGPRIPESTVSTDELCAVGRYVFVKRDNRIICLNLLAGYKGQYATAAWTELVLPTGLSMKSMAKLNGNIYFVMNNKVYRFAMSRTNASDTERGAFDNVQVNLTIATPTLGDTDQHQKVNWTRFAMRAKGNTGTSKIYSTKVIAGPSLDTTKPSYIKILDRVLDSRDEFVVPAGIGSSTEASGEAVFLGDVNLESATFFTSGSKMSRPAGGSDV